MSRLDADLAARLARIALGHVTREYPSGLSLALSGPEDLGEPHVLHPIFYGSFDWHSCVHSHWLLARVLRRFPEGEQAQAIAAQFEAVFTDDKVAGELAYLGRPLSGGFERPYGWAWLLMLTAELGRHETPQGRRWARAVQPLADAFVARFRRFLPRADYPVRAGVHSNTAFALALAHEYALAAGDRVFADLLRDKALAWYVADADCQAWEPSGDDFLSSALMEAELMRRILAAADFRDWFARFLPGAAQRRPASLFTPARVSDRSDGRIAHLDGLNLSRAWCWRGLAKAHEPDGPLAAVAEAAAQAHLDASLAQVSGDYMGEHWLASFALLALEAGEP
jgi:hypothetical protein